MSAFSGRDVDAANKREAAQYNGDNGAVIWFRAADWELMQDGEGPFEKVSLSAGVDRFFPGVIAIGSHRGRVPLTSSERRFNPTSQ